MTDKNGNTAHIGASHTGTAKLVITAALTEAEAATAAKARDLQGKLSRIPSEIEADRMELDDLAERIRNIRDDIRPKIYPNRRILIISVILAVLGLAALVVGIVLPQIVCIIAGAAAVIAGVAGNYSCLQA